MSALDPFQRIAELEAEVERLRVAFKVIAELAKSTIERPRKTYSDLRDDLERRAEIASAALTPKEPTP
jgi:hypothetical protein